MNKSLILIVIGGFLLLSGLSMPSQETQSTESCVDSNYDLADGCVETTYSVPNYGKYLSVFLGFIMVAGGFGGLYSSSDSGDQTTIDSSITENSGTGKEPESGDTNNSMLHNQIQSNDDDDR